MATNLSQTADADWNAINRRLVERIRQESATLDAEGVAAEAVATTSKKLASGQVSDPLAVAMSICDGLIRNGRRRGPTPVNDATSFNDLHRFGDDEGPAEGALEVEEEDPLDFETIEDVPRFYSWPELQAATRRVAAENFWRTSGREWDSEVHQDFERLIAGLNGPRVVVTPKDLEVVRKFTAELHSLLQLAELPSESGCTYPVRDWAKQAASKFLLENLDLLAQWGRGSQEDAEAAMLRIEALVYALDEHDFLGSGKPAEPRDLAYVAILLGWAPRAIQSDEEIGRGGLSVDELVGQLLPLVEAARAKYGYTVRESISRWRCKREDFDRMRVKRAATP